MACTYEHKNKGYMWLLFAWMRNMGDMHLIQNQNQNQKTLLYRIHCQYIAKHTLVCIQPMYLCWINYVIWTPQTKSRAACLMILKISWLHVHAVCFSRLTVTCLFVQWVSRQHTVPLGIPGHPSYTLCSVWGSISPPLISTVSPSCLLGLDRSYNAQSPVFLFDRRYTDRHNYTCSDRFLNSHPDSLYQRLVNMSGVRT